MTSKLNECQVCFCYGKKDNENKYNDSYILGYDKVCHYCKLSTVCNYCDEEGHDNRRCFRYLSNGTQFKCILYSIKGTNTDSRKRDLFFHSKII